jgi:hypothetical protein
MNDAPNARRTINPNAQVVTIVGILLHAPIRGNAMLEAEKNAA